MGVSKVANKLAWSIKRQSAFGTPLAKTDLTRFAKFADAILIDDAPEHWSDRGMVGLGHEWETQKGIIKQMVKVEIGSQPMDIDLISYLAAMFFSNVATVDNTGSYTHTAKWATLAAQAAAWPFSVAVCEDGVDQCVQDLAVQTLSIKGDGENRLEVGASLIGSKLATPLGTYTWPSAVAARYVYNYAGAFSIDAADKKSQLRSFELSLESGISQALAWKKAAAEADRIYPQEWPFTPERKMNLQVGIVAATGNLATFRAAWKAGTEMAVVLSCTGAEIGSSGEYDTVAITVPKAVITGLKESYSDGYQHLDLTLDGHYDSTTGGPLKIEVTNDEASIGAAAS